MTTRDVLKDKVGVCRQYVQIFAEMCQLANIRVKSIRGFAKGHTYIPGILAFLFFNVCISIVNNKTGNHTLLVSLLLKDTWLHISLYTH